VAARLPARDALDDRQLGHQLDDPTLAGHGIGDARDHALLQSLALELDLQPAPLKGIYGFEPNVSSWGGEVLHVDGTYHLYASEMVGGCGLTEWYSNSRIVHATSKSLLGPYGFKDEAIPLWSHGPSLAVDRSGSKPKYLLWRTGQMLGPSARAKSCDGKPQQTPATEPRMLHVADSPDGPWTPVSAPGLDGNLGHSTMPHIHVFSNGTIFVINQGNGAPLGTTGWTAFRAKSYKGPYESVDVVLAGNPGKETPFGVWEDPFVWFDEKHEVFKLLFHAGFYPGILENKCSTMRSGGLAFSTDGVNWIRSPVPPFSNTIQQVDGTEWTTSTRERPKLIFNDQGEPIALTSAVSGGDRHWSCKQTDGVDWTYTHMQPIGASSTVYV